MDKDIEVVVPRRSKLQQGAKLPPRHESSFMLKTVAPWFDKHLDFVRPPNGLSYLIAIDSTDNIGTQSSSALFQDFYRGHVVERTMEKIIDALLFMHRTTLHPAFNDRGPAETLVWRKPRPIHNFLLPTGSTLHSSFSCAKKTTATGTAIYVRDHRPSGPLRRVSSELGEVVSEIIETGNGFSGYHLNILEVFGLPLLGSNGTPEIQPGNQQNLRSEPFKKPPKRFQVDPTFTSYDGQFSPGGVG
ncbi:hypothetical protein ACTXT7_017002 [Hymenolepis weldensis]